MDPVKKLLRGVAAALAFYQPDVSPAGARRRLEYICDDIARGRSEPIVHDAELLACALLTRLPYWQVTELAADVGPMASELRAVPADALLVVLSLAVDELAAPPSAVAQRAAVVQVLAALCALVIPHMKDAGSAPGAVVPA